MLFSSLTFLLYFLPAVMLIHYFLPQKGQNVFLFAASLVFYAWGEARYVPLIVLLLLSNYTLGRFLPPDKGTAIRRKMLMAAGVVLNIGVLGFYKYAGFFLSGIGLSAYAPQVSLPLGISFFTFQTLGYLIDVYRGQTEPEKDFIDFSAFILLFPQLIAGPILRYGDLKNELHQKRRPRPEMLEKGMTLFVLGLAAKVLLANSLGEIWEELHLSSGMLCAWMALIGFGLQIYFDFYGYSLMAMGMGDMLGFSIAQNFDRPYISRSITEFWRRWHKTLSFWFRDYVYIPLGGSRRGRGRQIVNLFAVWALTGLWHGASWNFLLWGLYYFLLLLLEKFFLGEKLEKHPHFAHGLTLFLVMMGWALFAADDLKQLPGLLSSLFSFRQGGELLFWLRQYGVVLLLSAAACWPKALDGAGKLLEKSPWVRWLVLMILLVLCLCRLINSSYNPFLYFRF